MEFICTALPYVHDLTPWLSCCAEMCWIHFEWWLLWYFSVESKIQLPFVCYCMLTISFAPRMSFSIVARQIQTNTHFRSNDTTFIHILSLLKKSNSKHTFLERIELETTKRKREMNKNFRISCNNELSYRFQCLSVSSFWSNKLCQFSSSSMPFTSDLSILFIIYFVANYLLWVRKLVVKKFAFCHCFRCRLSN